MKKVLKRAGIIFVDISLTVLLLLGVYFVNYKLPQQGIQAAVLTGSNTVTADGFVRTNVKKDTTDWHTKFADKFTDTVVQKPLSYTSPNLSIHISKGRYLCGRHHLFTDSLGPGHLWNRL